MNYKTSHFQTKIICLISLQILAINSVEGPKISVRKGRQVHADCNGQFIKSLTAITCATPAECAKKESCLVEGETCALEKGKEIFMGSECYHDNGQKSCFSIDMEPLVTAGMIECKTWDGQHTLDHFFYGVDGEFHLASNPPKSSLLALQLSSPHGDARGTGERGDKLEAYKSELLNGKCIVPEFTSIESPKVNFMGVGKNGAKFKLDCDCLTENNIGGFKWVTIRQYAIPEDVMGFYCEITKANRAAKSYTVEEDDVISTVVNVTAWTS